MSSHGELIEKSKVLAKLYVDLSNDHNVDSIDPLFESDATYHSTFLGKTYHGKEPIMQMMREYFSSYKDVHWNVDLYSEETNNDEIATLVKEKGATCAVVFDYTRTCTIDNELKSNNGREWIIVSKDLKICHVQVKTQPKN